MPPFLPPELVTITFEYLYKSFSDSPGREMYDAPIGAGFVFSNLSLVSKTWHSLALPFLVRNFEDASRSGTKVERFINHLRKYDLGKHVESVSVVLGSKNGTSSLTLVRQLFSEIGQVWKPRLVELNYQGPYDPALRGCLAASLPFFQETKSLRLINLDLTFPSSWIPHLPTRLTSLDCNLNDCLGHPNLVTSLQLEIARRCSETLVRLSLRSTQKVWVTTAEEIFNSVTFPSLVHLCIEAVHCSHFDVSKYLPQLRSAIIPSDLVGLRFSNLPQSLRRLILCNIAEYNFDRVADDLKVLLPTVESLEHLGICANVSHEEDYVYFESIGKLLEHQKYLDLSNVCQSRGIEFSCHEWDPLFGDEVERTEEESGVLSRADDELDYVEEEEGEEETSSGEEELDFDAEDREEFRHLWSREKLAQFATEEKVYSVEETKGGTFGFET